MFATLRSYIMQKYCKKLEKHIWDSLANINPLPKPNPWQSHADQSQSNIRYIDWKKTALYDQMMLYDQMPQSLIHIILDINTNRSQSVLDLVFDALINQLPILRSQGHQTLIYTPLQTAGCDVRTLLSLQPLRTLDINQHHQSILQSTYTILQWSDHATVIIISDMLDNDTSFLSSLIHQHHTHIVQIPISPFGVNYRARELNISSDHQS